MKVLLTKPFFENDIKYISDRLNSGVELVFPKSYDEEGLCEYAGEAEVFFGSYMSDKLFREAGKLKLVQIPWTGVDNLDYQLLKKHDVTVANSHSNSGIVAEHAIALMFDAAKKVTYHDRMLREGKWNRPTNDGSNAISPFSFKIRNATVGMIGFGAIGKNIYHYLKGFNCTFKVFNRSGTGDQMENVSYYPIAKVNAGVEEVDIIFVAIALTEQTEGLIDEGFFQSMSSKTIFVNVSRGAVVKEAALYDALKQDSTIVAGIDTWYKYPNKENPDTFPSEKYDFHTLNNIVLSPHRAGMVDGGLPHLDDAIENLNRLAENQELINIISIENKY